MSQTMRWIFGGDKGQNVHMSLPISEFILSVKGLLTDIRDCLKSISGGKGIRKVGEVCIFLFAECLYISFLHFLKDKKGVISTSKQLCQKLAFCGHHGSYSCVLLYAEYNSHVSVEGLYFLLVRTNVSVL